MQKYQIFIDYSSTLKVNTLSVLEKITLFSRYKTEQKIQVLLLLLFSMNVVKIQMLGSIFIKNFLSTLFGIRKPKNGVQDKEALQLVVSTMLHPSLEKDFISIPFLHLSVVQLLLQI